MTTMATIALTPSSSRPHVDRRRCTARPAAAAAPPHPHRGRGPGRLASTPSHRQSRWLRSARPHPQVVGAHEQRDAHEDAAEPDQRRDQHHANLTAAARGAARFTTQASSADRVGGVAARVRRAGPGPAGAGVSDDPCQVTGSRRRPVEGASQYQRATRRSLHLCSLRTAARAARVRASCAPESRPCRRVEMRSDSTMRVDGHAMGGHREPAPVPGADPGTELHARRGAFVPVPAGVEPPHPRTRARGRRGAVRPRQPHRVPDAGRRALPALRGAAARAVRRGHRGRAAGRRPPGRRRVARGPVPSGGRRAHRHRAGGVPAAGAGDPGARRRRGQSRRRHRPRRRACRRLPGLGTGRRAEDGDTEPVRRRPARSPWPTVIPSRPARWSPSTRCGPSP